MNLVSLSLKGFEGSLSVKSDVFVSNWLSDKPTVSDSSPGTSTARELREVTGQVMSEVHKLNCIYEKEEAMELRAVWFSVLFRRRLYLQ